MVGLRLDVCFVRAYVGRDTRSRSKTRRQPARWGSLAVRRSTVTSPRLSLRPLARPRWSWQTVSGSPRDAALPHLVNDEVGLFQHGEMLAHRVVIQSHVVGQFRYPDWLVGVNDVAEQAVARRVAEGPGLELDGDRVHESPREPTGAALRL